MDENIVDRLRLHGGWLGECIDEEVVKFERIAVTPEQVDEYKLEPDPKPVSKKGMGKRYFKRLGTMTHGRSRHCLRRSRNESSATRSKT